MKKICAVFEIIALALTIVFAACCGGALDVALAKMVYLVNRA